MAQTEKKKGFLSIVPISLSSSWPPFPSYFASLSNGQLSKESKKNEHNGKWQTDEAEVGGRKKRKRNTNNAYARSVVVVCQPVSQQESSWRKGKG